MASHRNASDKDLVQVLFNLKCKRSPAERASLISGLGYEVIEKDLYMCSGAALAGTRLFRIYCTEHCHLKL